VLVVRAPLSFTSETWSGGLVAGVPADVRRLAVRRGVVLVGGEREVLMLRAGAERMASRAIPGAVAPLRAVSIEPRRSPRLAFGAPRAVAVLDGDAVGTRRLDPSASPLEDLAWGPRPGGGWSLYEMSEEGLLVRTRPETGDAEEIPIGYLVALATADDGLLAVASIDREAPAVWTTRDGETWSYRLLPELDGMGVHGFAVAGEAVAISLAGNGVFMSRSEDAPFVRCDALEGGTALAFEGDGPAAPLLGAVHDEFAETIVRVEADGTAARVVTIETPAGSPEPYVSALAWDASRSALWASIQGIGLLRSVPRRARGGQLS
jgi:hypothetical protein